MQIGDDALLQYLKEDLEKYGSSIELVNANLLERKTVKRADPHMLHANPDDEFSDPEIGPNNEILQNYSRMARHMMAMDETVFDEPITVSKMKPEGYMILNGHHRWLAAIKKNVKKVRIEIVNREEED